MPKKLIPAFSIAFDAPVWKVEASPSARRLFVELRDADRHQVRFAALELPAGRLLWSSLPLKETWWITLAMAGDRYLLLQTFTDTNNPEKKTCFAVEIASRQIVWQSDHFQVLGLDNDQLFGYEIRDESRAFSHIKLPEGVVSETNYPQKMLQEENKDFYQPFFYSENQSYFTTVADFVESRGFRRPVGGCEYLEYGNYVCIAYYTSDKKELANYLLIIDQDGTILMHECLEVSVPNPTLGTFFIANDQLIVVQHKLQLVSYALP